MLSRLINPLRHLLDRHHLTCFVTLLVFVASTVGIPVQLLGLPSAGCRCGEALQASGQCCCSKARRTGSPVSCCTTTAPQASTPSCCAKKTSCCEKSPSQPSQSCGLSAKACGCVKSRSTSTDSSNSETLAFTACGCGGGPADAGLLTNTEPRILTNVAVVSAYQADIRWSPRSELLPPCHSFPPETPPPEVQLSQPAFA